MVNRMKSTCCSVKSVAIEASAVSSIESRVGSSDMSLVRNNKAIVSSVLNSVRNGWSIKRFWNWREHLFLQKFNVFLLIQKLSCSLCNHRANSQHHIICSIWSKSIRLNCFHKFVSVGTFQDSWVI